MSFLYGFLPCSTGENVSPGKTYQIKALCMGVGRTQGMRMALSPLVAMFVAIFIVSSLGQGVICLINPNQLPGLYAK